jgi:ATP-dependent DNA helicase RecG
MNLTDFDTIEQTTLDYKLSLEERRPKSWLKSVSAFANTHGGHIIFGVDDKTHAVVGVDNPQYVASKVTELIKARVNPVPRFDVSSIQEGDRVCIDLNVGDGPVYPYYYAADGVREAYIRVGDQSLLAPDYALNNLILKGQNRTYDSLPGQYRMGEVSFTLLGATYRKETGDAFDYEKDPVSMGLAEVDGQVTNAGLLLCDQGLLRQSRVFCTRWKGLYKGTVEEDALDDREYQECSLITLLQNAEDFVRNNSRTPWTIRGMQREERSDYPQKAVREALVNALIHRDYQVVGSEIHVDMYPDRLEITSPGGMINGKQIQNMDLRHIPSLRRNQIISDLFSRLHLMERRGSGIGRILGGYMDFEVKPEFYSDPDFFIVTLPNKGYGIESNAENAKSNAKQQESNVELGETVTFYESEAEQELSAFRTKAENAMPSAKNSSIERIVEMFRRYRCEYAFNRNNVADSFGITPIRASSVIHKMIDCGLARKVKNGEYYFCL